MKNLKADLSTKRYDFAHGAARPVNAGIGGSGIGLPLNTAVRLNAVVEA